MKIDTSTIEGFDTLTPEEQVSALLDLEINDGTEDLKRYKELISKANSEAKKYKDAAKDAESRIKAQMSEDERVKAETEEHYRQIEEENNALKREALIAKKSSFYKSIGFNDALAEETAKAFADGDFDTVEKNHLTAHAEFEKNLKADGVRNNPRPQNSGGTQRMTKAEIMSVKDTVTRQKLISENIDLFV